VEQPGTVGGIVNTAVRAGRGAVAGLDILGAAARGGKKNEYLAQAERLEQQAANIDSLQPGWTPENRKSFADRALKSAAQLRERGGAMGASQMQQLTSAAEQIKKAGELSGSPAYEAYSQAKGWDAVSKFLQDPFEVSFNIAAEGAAGSLPTLVAGAAGAAAGGVPGAMAGSAIGSFSSEYASTLVQTFSDAGVDVSNPDQLAQAFQDPQLMAVAQKRGLARGIPVAAFDALSMGLAGRAVAPAVGAGAKAIAKAAGTELVQQAGAGMAGETAGQVSEQLATTGEVTDLNLKDIVAEGIGELVPGAAQIAGGAAMRGVKPGATPPGTGPATPAVPTHPTARAPNVSSTEAEARLQAEAAKDPALAALLAESKSAAESAEVFEPALKERENTPPPAKSAVESAMVFQEGAAEERGLAAAEEGAQALVDELQEASGKPREEILATRAGKDIAQWAEELQGEIEYAKSPLTVNPERRASELQADLDRVNREWDAHVNALAERTKVSQIVEGEFAGIKAKHDELSQRKAAIEDGLTELERVRRSPQGAVGLAGELAQESGRVAPDEPATPVTPDESPVVAAEAEAAPVESPANEAPKELPSVAPAQAEAPTPEQDRARYAQIQAEWADLRKQGVPPNDPRIMDLWRENEEIKNRHEGMPPAAEAPDFNPDTPVVIEAKRSTTGEMVKVEMPAAKAEQMLDSRIKVLKKVADCLKQ